MNYQAWRQQWRYIKAIELLAQENPITILLKNLV